MTRLASVVLWVCGAALLMNALTATQALAAATASTGYSAAALYNAGNAFARAGEPGMAVLNYERAELLAPQDRDIDFNLNHVRQIARLPVEPRSRFDQAARYLSPTAAAGMGLVGLMLLGTSLLAALLSRRGAALRWSAAALGVALIGIPVCQAALLWPLLHSAVVVKATQALVSPVPMGDVLFDLPEAETVVLTAAREQYVLVKTRAGRTGWVPRSSLVPVVEQTGGQ